MIAVAKATVLIDLAVSSQGSMSVMGVFHQLTVRGHPPNFLQTPFLDSFRADDSGVNRDRCVCRYDWREVAYLRA